MLQVHFGADYTTGVYGWTTKLDPIKRSIDWQLKNLKTDYIDFGFVHCLDERKDLENYEKNGVLQFIMELKSQGGGKASWTFHPYPGAGQRDAGQKNPRYADVLHQSHV